MQSYCLVDIHISPENHLAFTHDRGNKCFFSSPSSESRGVAVLFSDFEYEILDIDKDYIGNFLLLKICIGKDFTFLLVILYRPNKDEPEFYENIKDKLSTKENIPLILCGK